MTVARPMWTVDVDVGGTMTDGLFRSGAETLAVKVDTTPHDLTVCLFECLTEAALRLEFPDLKAFLGRVEIIRWNSTVATNVLAERKGPRIGALLSQGGAAGLYGTDTDPLIGSLIGPSDIAELGESTEPEEVLTRVKALLERGVRRLVVSFRGAFTAPEGEQRVKRWIDAQYPDHCLGAVPVLLGTEILKDPDDQARTRHAITNSYVHGPLATSLFKAEDRLLFELEYRRPFLIGHVNGGTARVAKTRALDTIESGPVFGVYGAADAARRYGDPAVVTLDVGGTTSKVGLIAGGSPVTWRNPEVFGIPLRMSMVLLHSIALGGGSLISVRDRALTLGPESAGALPGPVSYGLGGEQPTLTDAFLVLGWLDAEYFMGGVRVLDVEAARQALAEQVGRPLGLTVEEAAALAADRAFGMVADAIRITAGERLYTTLYAFGGNGPLVACGVAEKLGIPHVRAFDLGAVWSAFGSSVSPLAHTYEAGVFLALAGPAIAEIRRAVEELMAECSRDMAGEGVAADRVEHRVEVDIGDGRHRSLVVPLTVAEVEARDLLGHLQRATTSLGSSPRIERVRLIGESRTGAAAKGGDVGSRNAGVPANPKRERPALWASARLATRVYDRGALGPGSEMLGPAVVEDAQTTWVVPPGWHLSIDARSNGLFVGEGAQR